MSELVPAGAAALAAREVARRYAGQSMSSATLRAYRSDWADWEAWAIAHGVGALPADPVDVAAYIASLAATHAPNTIRRRLSALSRMHALSDLEWDSGHRAITSTLRGLLRTHGRPDKKAAPIGLELIQALVGTCDGSIAGLRDRAMLLIGFAGALRRSELVGLLIQDVALTPGGLRIRISRSKNGSDRRRARGRHSGGQARCNLPCVGVAGLALHAAGAHRAAIPADPKRGYRPQCTATVRCRRHSRAAGAACRRCRSAVTARVARGLHYRGLWQGGAGRRHYAAQSAPRSQDNAGLRSAGRATD